MAVVDLAVGEVGCACDDGDVVSFLHPFPGVLQRSCGRGIDFGREVVREEQDSLS